MRTNLAPIALVAMGLALVSSACSPATPSSQVMLVDLPLHDPTPAALRAAWKRDCIGFGGYFRPDYLVTLERDDDGKSLFSAARNDTSEVGRSSPLKTVSAHYATADEAIRDTPKIIRAVVEGDVRSACAYLYPDQDLRFEEVSDLYRATEELGFRRVNLLVTEAAE